MTVRDTPAGYGKASKALHWSMAVLFLWQFAGMLSKVLLGRDSVVTSVLSGNHAQVGSVLLILICIRVVWAVLNRTRRPPHQTGALGVAARVGHASMYALMLAVPVIAVLRAWGGERGFAPFGFVVFAPRDPENVVTWAVNLGGLLHGELAWLLGALILGHVVMALFHQFVLKDGLLRRMTYGKDPQ